MSILQDAVNQSIDGSQKQLAAIAVKAVNDSDVAKQVTYVILPAVLLVLGLTIILVAKKL